MTHGNEISIPNVKYVNMKINEHGYEQRIAMFLFKKQNLKIFYTFMHLRCLYYVFVFFYVIEIFKEEIDILKIIAFLFTKKNTLYHRSNPMKTCLRQP